MKDWQEHWATFPTNFGPDEYLRQVGKVWHGEPITRDQIERLVADVLGKLDLGPEDSLLDLCCGNGLLTHRLAPACTRVVGVDFSAPLLDVARRAHPLGTGTYARASALDIAGLELGGPFTRVLCYEALQHFSPWELGPLLDAVLAQASDDVVILLGSVPDERRKWSFYRTPAYRADYLERLKRGEEAIGTWWAPVLVQDACDARGLRMEILEQDPDLHTAHYRFDCRIRKA